MKQRSEDHDDADGDGSSVNDADDRRYTLGCRIWMLDRWVVKSEEIEEGIHIGENDEAAEEEEDKDPVHEVSHVEHGSGPLDIAVDGVERGHCERRFSVDSRRCC